MNAQENQRWKKNSSEELNVYAGVYKVLLAGMLLSTALFLAAIVKALLRPQSYPLTPEWVRQQYRWPVIVHGIRSFDPPVIMLIATVLLILTPITRVVVSIYAFAADHDHKFVVITFVVLLVIVLTVVLAMFGLQ